MCIIHTDVCYITSICIPDMVILAKAQIAAFVKYESFIIWIVPHKCVSGINIIYLEMLQMKVTHKWCQQQHLWLNITYNDEGDVIYTSLYDLIRGLFY